MKKRSMKTALCLLLIALCTLPLLSSCGRDAETETETETTPETTPEEKPVFPLDYYAFERVDADITQMVTVGPQIPEEILPYMTTEQLWETCLRYPNKVWSPEVSPLSSTYYPVFLGDPPVFNGLRELLARPELSDLLAARYEDRATSGAGELAEEEDRLTRDLAQRYYITRTAATAILQCLPAAGETSSAAEGSVQSELRAALEELTKTETYTGENPYPEAYFDFDINPIMYDSDGQKRYGQIPEKILPRLSTKQLFATCLRSPLDGGSYNMDPFSVGYSSISFYNNSSISSFYKSSISSFYKMKGTRIDRLWQGPYSFNGIAALMRRDDLSSALVEYYTALTAEEVTAEDGLADDANEYTAFMAQHGLVTPEDCRTIYARLDALSDAYAALDPSQSGIFGSYFKLRSILSTRMSAPQ